MSTALDICDGDFEGPRIEEAGSKLLVITTYGIYGERYSNHGRYSRGWSGVPGAVKGVNEELSVSVVGFFEFDFEQWCCDVVLMSFDMGGLEGKI